MPDFIRDLHVFLPGREIAQGCRIYLEARETMTLRPALHTLTICDLSESSAAHLRPGERLSIESGISTLCTGTIMESYTNQTSGKQLTTIVFSPSISLWQSSVSLSLLSGMKVSDTIRALLSASGTEIPLAAFTAEDTVLFRPQSFFGRNCDALPILAETVNADIFMSSAGICVSGRDSQAPMYILSDPDLLSLTEAATNHVILTLSMIGWLLGTVIQASWKGRTYTGRIISTLIQADNTSGPWKSELELELF